MAIIARKLQPQQRYPTPAGIGKPMSKPSRPVPTPTRRAVASARRSLCPVIKFGCADAVFGQQRPVAINHDQPRDAGTSWCHGAPDSAVC